MAYLNYFLQFKAFADKNPLNSPSLALTNWVRDIQGVIVNNVQTQFITIPANTSIAVFASANKTFAYVETSAPLDITINGLAAPRITPVVIGSATQPGSFLINASITSLVLTNPSITDSLDVFLANAE